MFAPRNRGVLPRGMPHEKQIFSYCEIHGIHSESAEVKGIPPTRLWHSLNVPLPRPAGRSLAELGFFVPSRLPLGSLEPRDSAPSKRGLQLGSRPVRCAALFTTKVAARAAVEALVEAGL